MLVCKYGRSLVCYQRVVVGHWLAAGCCWRVCCCWLRVSHTCPPSCKTSPPLNLC